MSGNKNRFKALLSSDDNKKSNKFLNSNKKWKGDKNNDNRWKNNGNDKKNVFQSRRNNREGKRKYFGRNRVIPMNNDPNFKPNLVGRGEVSFTPQFKSGNQIQKNKNKKKNNLKPLIKKEEVEDKISEEELKLTLALAEKYQYFTESEEEEEEEDEEYDPLTPPTHIV
tara:strand:- start:116 stop:619 length:504 start_codon:yes stop_codon:yes gene_type:complete